MNSDNGSWIHLGPWMYCHLSSTFQSSRCKGGIYISSLEDMMNKHLHNIHFILSILGSLKHMELCLLHTPTHLHDIPWTLRGVSTVARWDNSLFPIVSGNFISIFPFGYQKRGSDVFRPASFESISHSNPILPSSIFPCSLPYLVKLSYDVSFLSRDLHVVLKTDMFVSPRSVDF